VGGNAAHGKHGDDLLGESIPDHTRPSLARAIKVVAIWLPLWLGPVALLLIFLGPDDVFARLSVFFSQVAVVSFGGAYAVLAYVAQQAVEIYHWLQPGEMLAGLGMAETTPGPLIMVVQYVGFLAGYRTPGVMSPLMTGTLAGLLVTWVTFTPCFLWVFLGAPYVEALRGARALGAALSAVTAAVVGVILNLAVWFGVHVAFRETVPWHGYGLSLSLPVLPSLDVFATLIAIAAAIALFRFKVRRHSNPSGLLACRHGATARLWRCAMTAAAGRVAVLWRGDRDARRQATPENNRFHEIFAALKALNIEAQPAIYSEELADEVRAQLLGVEGVLVWLIRSPMDGTGASSMRCSARWHLAALG